MFLSNKGFLLIDALLSVFIVSCVCILCFSIFRIIDNYEKGFTEYQKNSNRHYEMIFQDLPECEGCAFDESD